MEGGGARRMDEDERDEWTTTVRVFGASGGKAATSDKHERQTRATNTSKYLSIC